MVSRVLVAALLLLASTTSARAAAPPVWVRTIRESALWSGPIDPAEQFTSLPAGAFAIAQGQSVGTRALVYYPGDGSARQAGLAWIASTDVAPSGSPEWVSTAEIDSATAADAPRRAAYITPPEVSAPEVAVVDDATGLLLYGHAAHAREAPASTTKMVTALVALDLAESLDASLPITIDGWAMAAADGSSVMGLSPGRRLSLRTLLYGLLLPSGNDAAEQLARGLAVSRAEFVALMNRRVDELGLHDTRFVNPSGLDAPSHYSSAYDLAQLARAAMRDETFRTVVGTPEYAAEGFDLRGHNPLLGVYPGTDGVKTGSTDAAGKTMVASVVRDDHRVYVAVMHSDDLLADCTALFDWTWSAFRWD